MEPRLICYIYNLKASPYFTDNESHAQQRNATKLVFTDNFKILRNMWIFHRLSSRLSPSWIPHAERNLFSRMWPLRRPVVEGARSTKVPSLWKFHARCRYIIRKNRVPQTENRQGVQQLHDETRKGAKGKSEKFETRRSVLPCYRNQIPKEFPVSRREKKKRRRQWLAT